MRVYIYTYSHIYAYIFIHMYVCIYTHVYSYFCSLKHIVLEYFMLFEKMPEAK